ncbi:hypothetical protein DRP77_06165 [Candidatus Poribacteria bacterium]|nr:MAG: hypothetical protein DRP77_06165 [Candidatus Poribacteria bacterium]
MRGERIDEEVVIRIWERRLFDELRTTDGRPVTVLSPGERREGGPDFANAHILIGAEAVKGDVEVHVNASDWYSHEHHLDPLYNNVVLHVVMWDDGVSLLTRKEDGGRIPTVELHDKLRMPLEEILKEMRVPSAKPCAKAGEKPERVLNLLDQLGWERLLEKVDLMDEMAERTGFEGAFFRRLMDALGYSANRGPFSELAGMVEPEELMGRELREVEAVLFWRSGLLPDPDDRMDEETRGYVIELLEAVEGMGLSDERMGREEWRFAGIRPLNSPARRIAAAADILSRSEESLFLPFLEVVSRYSSGDLKLREAIRLLREPLRVETKGYWRDRFDFGKRLGRPCPTLLGEGRAADIVVNVVLPAVYLWAAETDNSSLSEAVSEIYHAHPKLGENRITRSFKPILKGVKIDTACKQQGLIFVYKTFCSSGGCDVCPLASWNL